MIQTKQNDWDEHRLPSTLRSCHPNLYSPLDLYSLIGHLYHGRLVDSSAVHQAHLQVIPGPWQVGILEARGWSGRKSST